MMNRRFFVAGGAALLAVPAFAEASAIKLVGVQVWELNKMPPQLQTDVLNAIKAQEAKNRTCMNEFSFASLVGKKLREAEDDNPAGTPGMRFSGPCRVVITSIATDNQTCAILDERNAFDALIPDGGILDHHRAVEDVRGRHLRFLFPRAPKANYEVLYPLVPPNSSLPETRLLAYEWKKTRNSEEEWRRQSIHAVVRRLG